MKAGFLIPCMIALTGISACEFISKLAPNPRLASSGGEAGELDAPNCASCHAYPLNDVVHSYHLLSTHVNSNNLGRPEHNALTTCLDCHSQSIRHFGFSHSDTTWVDKDGNPIEQHTAPDDKVGSVAIYPRLRPLPYIPVDILRGEALAAEVDSLIFRYARLGDMVPWRTGTAHDNGKVDVSFPFNNLTGKIPPAEAYRPRDISCSSISCHNSPEKPYRFMSSLRGLSHCPSLDDGDSTCLGALP